MPKELVGIKREKVNKDVSSGLIRVTGENLERTKNGSKSVSPSPTKSLAVEGGKGSKK